MARLDQGRVLLAQLQRLLPERFNIGHTTIQLENNPLEAVVEGAVQRLRPKLMTVSAIILGLVPLMWSTETGSEVMRPLATPLIGGMISSTLLVLIVIPVIFLWMKERQLRQSSEPRS